MARLSVKKFTDAALRAASGAGRGMQSRYSLNIRDNSAISLNEGVARYHAVYRELLGTPMRLVK